MNGVLEDVLRQQVSLPSAVLSTAFDRLFTAIALPFP